MVSAQVTTGSTVYGTVPGLKDHLGGGCALMYIQGNPSGIVSPVEPGVEDMSGISGATIAYDYSADKLFRHVSGVNNNLWVELISGAFT